MKIINLQEQIEQYRGILFAKYFLRNIIALLMLTVVFSPFAVILRYILSGIETNRESALLLGRRIFKFIYYVGIIIMLVYSVIILSNLNSFLIGFALPILWIAFILWHKLISPVINGLRDAQRFYNKNEYLIDSTDKDHSYLNILTSLFKLSKFTQNSRIRRIGSSFLSISSNLVFLIYIMFLLLAPLLTMTSISNWISILDPSITPTKVAKYEYTSYVGAQVIYLSFQFFFFAVLLSFVSWVFRFASDLINRTCLDEYRKIDTRKPILFLRAFADKKVKLGKSKRPFAYKALLREGSLKYLDNLLVDKYWNIAPIYSFANPDGELNLSGTIKQKVDHDSWHTKIQSLMNKSMTIFVSVGNTKSLHWEINNICSNNYLDKTFLFFSKNDRLNCGIEKMLPGFRALSSDERKLLDNKYTRAIIYNNGEPIALQAKDDDPISLLYMISYYFDLKGITKHQDVQRCGSEWTFSVFITLIAFYLMFFWQISNSVVT